MAKITYVKCPRCELNYIDSTADMCDVCKAELGLIKSLDSEEESGYDEGVYYCSVCKRVPVAGEDDICEACAAKMEIEHVDPLAEEDDESWRKEYIDDEPVVEEPIEIPLEELQDEEYDTVYDDEEELISDTYEDEFEDAELEEIGEFDDDEDLDEDEEEEDEEE